MADTAHPATTSHLDGIATTDVTEGIEATERIAAIAVVVTEAEVIAVEVIAAPTVAEGADDLAPPNTATDRAARRAMLMRTHRAEVTATVSVRTVTPQAATAVPLSGSGNGTAIAVQQEDPDAMTVMMEVAAEIGRTAT